MPWIRASFLLPPLEPAADELVLDVLAPAEPELELELELEFELEPQPATTSAPATTAASSDDWHSPLHLSSFSVTA